MHEKQSKSLLRLLKIDVDANGKNGKKCQSCLFMYSKDRFLVHHLMNRPSCRKAYSYKDLNEILEKVCPNWKISMKYDRLNKLKHMTKHFQSSEYSCKIENLEKEISEINQSKTDDSMEIQVENQSKTGISLEIQDQNQSQTGKFMEIHVDIREENQSNTGKSMEIQVENQSETDRSTEIQEENQSKTDGSMEIQDKNQSKIPNNESKEEKTANEISEIIHENEEIEIDFTKKHCSNCGMEFSHRLNLMQHLIKMEICRKNFRQIELDGLIKSICPKWKGISSTKDLSSPDQEHLYR